MLFQSDRNESRGTGRATRVSQRARIGVEALEGRRLMDAAASAALSASAQAHAQLALAQQSALQSTIAQARAQVTAQTQNSVSLLAKAEQKLVGVIAREVQWLQHASASARGSATFSAHARVLAQAKGQLGAVNGIEASLGRMSASARAQLEQKASTSLRLSGDAVARARLEVTAASRGDSRTAQTLRAQVDQALSALQQAKAGVQAAVGAAVKGAVSSAHSISVQVDQTASVAQTLQLGMGVSGSIGVLGRASV